MVDFDLWRQLTVEHLIGENQGGFLKAISQALADGFPEMNGDERRQLTLRVDPRPIRSPLVRFATPPPAGRALPSQCLTP